jgi:Protein of unknown function (DUF3987)
VRVDKDLQKVTVQLRTLQNEEPIPRQVRVNDITPAGLIEFLAANRGAGLVLAAEPSFLDNVGRYAQQALPTLLSAERGDTIPHNRARKRPLLITEPSVSLAAMPQPRAIADLAKLRGARERGLLARFFLVYAESRTGERDTTAPPMDAAVQVGYGGRMLRLLTWADAVRGPVDIVLSSAAHLTFARFHQQIEKRLGRDANLGDDELVFWGTKLPGRTLKIALVLHLFDYLEDAPSDLIAFGEHLPSEISRETLERAITIVEYIIPHQIAAFGAMLGGAAWADAERILAWAEHTQRTEFSQRDARYALPKIVQNSHECTARVGSALSLLLAIGAITRKEPEPAEKQPKTGRPHSPIYQVVEEPETNL